MQGYGSDSRTQELINTGDSVMKDTERALLREALATGNADTVNKACRNILRTRLQWDDQPDRKLRFLLEDIAAKISFPLSFSIVTPPVREEPSNPNMMNVALWAVLALAGLCVCIWGSLGLGIAGFCLGALGGFGMGKTLNGAKRMPSVEPSLRVTTTAEELEKEVEEIYAALTGLYHYRQLEGRLISILNWFQHSYSDENTTEETRKGIRKLLAQFGYEFVDFTPERSPDFELNMGNVNQPLTTEPAIINGEGTAVCKGTAVLPKMK